MIINTLTSHDFSILEKIKDPESDCSRPVLLDSSLPRDPHVSDSEVYASLVQQEKKCIESIMNQPLSPSASSSFDQIIEQWPNYASARNNRVQALRMYGDDILVIDNNLDPESSEPIIRRAEMILMDLNIVISLLSPQSPYKAIHPTSAKTLSQAYSQRGALYLSAASLLASPSMTEKRVCLGAMHPESSWGEMDFREAASRDFMMGGQFGNPIAKALAVATNPTAKLCGRMVQEALRKEYGQ